MLTLDAIDASLAANKAYKRLDAQYFQQQLRVHGGNLDNLHKAQEAEFQIYITAFGSIADIAGSYPMGDVAAIGSTADIACFAS